MEQLTRSSGARIQLSRAGEFYPGLWPRGCWQRQESRRCKAAAHGRNVACQPTTHAGSTLRAAGTSDRVLLLSGSLHSVLTAIFLILEKVARDAAATRAKTGKGKPEEREDEVRSCRGHTASTQHACSGCTRVGAHVACICWSLTNTVLPRLCSVGGHPLTPNLSTTWTPGVVIKYTGQVAALPGSIGGAAQAAARLAELVLDDPTEDQTQTEGGQTALP